MLWPTGVLQDEIEVAANKEQDFTEIDRRGSSCPTLFAWNGQRIRLGRRHARRGRRRTLGRGGPR